MTTLILHGTDGCHLCEEAAALLQAAAVDFQERDIIDDPAALQRYAIRIPVVQHSASGAELGWPFDADTLTAFLNTLA